MKKIYYLGTCSTCIRIIKELGITPDHVVMQDIKQEAITDAQLKQMAEMAGSYEALFSRRAMKYKSLGLAEMNLDEDDYKKYILDEYTFLKRPVIIVDEHIFVGNSKKIVEQAGEALR